MLQLVWFLANIMIMHDYDYALKGYNNSTAGYNWNLTELNYLCCHEIDSV